MASVLGNISLGMGSDQFLDDVRGHEVIHRFSQVVHLPQQLDVFDLDRRNVHRSSSFDLDFDEKERYNIR